MTDKASPSPAPPPAQVNADQSEYWNGRAGETWSSHQVRLDTAMARITDAALSFAQAAKGEAILDIGCGCGTTTFELQARSGETGKVVGVDISSPMLNTARARAAAEAIAPEFLLADASTHQFSRQSFDLLFSRFGVMFFEDPVAAFTHLRETMKPGARMAFVCWRSMAENAWVSVPLKAAIDHFPEPPQPTPPGTPGPFAFADPQYLTGILQKAGFEKIQMAPLDSYMTIGQSEHEPLTDAVDFVTDVGPLARMLREQKPEVAEQALAAVRRALATYVGPNGVELAAACWLVGAKA